LIGKAFSATPLFTPVLPRPLKSTWVVETLWRRSTRSPEHFHLGLQPAAETVAFGIEVVRGLEI